MKRTVALIFVLAACSSASPPPSRDRNWTTQPAFVVQSAPAAQVWVVSDIHGGIDRLIALLQGQGLIDGNRAWSAGAAHLYVLGDMIDKASGGLDTMRFLQGLQRPAAAAGGEVVVTMGNHEAEFLADPLNAKAAPFLVDLTDAHLDPNAVAEGDDIGAWMRALPFGILDGDWFFSHAGNTGGRTLDGLAQAIEADVGTGHFGASNLIAMDSLLEAELWWQTADPAATVDLNLGALPARHLVFGHDPSALGLRGSLGQLLEGRLFLVDVGMSPAVNDSQGALLLIERGATGTVVSAAFPSGLPAMLFQE